MQMRGGVLGRRAGVPLPLTLPLVSQITAFGLLPVLDAWITAVWSLISILVVLVAMVIEFT